MQSIALAKLLSVRPQLLRRWVEYGLLDGDVRTGRGYEYSELDVLRARLVARRKREQVGLQRIEKELRGLDAEALAVLLGDKKPAPKGAATMEAPIGAGARVIELMAGLTLLLRDDASPLAQRVARDIAAARWPA